KVTETFSLPIIRVRDSLLGLQELARNYRRSLSIPVVGITGSSGKTSTKDLLRAVFEKQGLVNATHGNLNNHIGLPLSVLNTSGRDEFAVFEMGMSHPGEIERLAEIAQPTAGVITCIGTAHLGQMGSQEAIAEEKGMLVEAIRSDGFVVLPANDPFTPSLRERCQGSVITAGVEGGDVEASQLEMDFDEVRFVVKARGEVVPGKLPTAAEHMVRNAMLAIGVALEWGLSLGDAVASLEEGVLTEGRLQRKVIRGISFLDDSYNANPESMAAALSTLKSLPITGRRIAILGKMAELGDHADEAHRALGREAAEKGIDIVIGIGEEGALIGQGAGTAVAAHLFEDHREVATFLRSEVNEDDVVLLKGSRSARMETVLTCLTSS
ncbi:MAG: UDP-N-acetylmuramoyl-tripeptide--D-alanyl-D-alanine ligase, partial [Verrucomicrobiota bacterium]